MKKFVEDLVDQEQIDISALDSADFKRPFFHKIRYCFLTIKDKAEILYWTLLNTIRCTIK